MPDTQQNTKSLPLLAAYPFADAHGLGSEASRIRSMSASSSVRRGHIVQLFRQNGLLDEFIRQHWTFGATPDGAKQLRYYDHLWARSEGGPNDPQEGAVGVDEDDAAEQRFALEADLRDFLAANLGVLEPGMRLYERDGRKGVEFAIDAGFIDILAVDREDKLVVIELKLSRGRNRAVGQLLYYMGWIDKHLGGGPCRGFIVASEITDELRLAVARVPGVSLARYRVTMSVEHVPVHGEV